MHCKNCNALEIVKNGQVRNQQRYKCKTCNYNFVEGDKRSKASTKIKQALAIILYSQGKASFRFLAKLFDTSVSQVYRWIANEARYVGEPEVRAELEHIELDEMWHFIRSKKTKNGYLKPWIVIHGELLPGYSVVVMLQRLNGSITK